MALRTDAKLPLNSKKKSVQGEKCAKNWKGAKWADNSGFRERAMEKKTIILAVIVGEKGL